ncbi:hypothetical protein DPEC_G00235810 [Dallia pectoralis]|uniref:Uncharacterized protein n=1 Tax=Dallia pectoralis TaxID=75939 RepID=A0ACC2FY28_DALPE|nr:hypothetical protein DPEC_G00235810 [Dallia pectoralis]
MRPEPIRRQRTGKSAAALHLHICSVNIPGDRRNSAHNTGKTLTNRVPCLSGADARDNAQHHSGGQHPTVCRASESSIQSRQRWCAERCRGSSLTPWALLRRGTALPSAVQTCGCLRCAAAEMASQSHNGTPGDGASC